MECGKEYKAIIRRHLKSHDITLEEYKSKWPDAQIWPPKSKEMREKISRATKKGMHKPESWAKFKTHIDSRDISGKNNPFYGKNHTDETKKKISENEERSSKISEKKTEWWSTRVGQTVEELFGEETGKRIRKIKSEQTSGERNPAYGKVYENAGCKRGFYKGKKFRSLWELSFYKHLESENVDLDLDVIYEPFAINYSYNNKRRTYTPDFLIENKILVEVKSSWTLREAPYCDTGLLFAKVKAAEEYCKENGMTFKILTEDDFPIIKTIIAKSDPDIIWSKGVTFR